jgi:linearmycin/streptolysin S transport system permease protein
MIFAVARNRLMNLRHDRAALVLVFLVPLVFFSIFAGIFAGGSGRSATRKVRVAVVDEDGSENSKRFVAALRAETALSVVLAPSAEGGTAAPPYTAATAEEAVHKGDLPLALIVPKGFGDRPVRFGPGAERPRVTVLSDSSDPIAPQILAGLLQKVAMAAMPDTLVRGGIDALEKWGGGLTPEQRARLERSVERLREMPPAPAPGKVSGGAAADGGLIDVVTRDVVGETKKNPTVAFYAAGIGVMFLLFSAAGAGGALIEEAESGTLDRILSTRVSMTKLLLGKLLYLATLAAMQLTVMFVWGALVFHLELASHLAGFAIMTVVTALAASTFGLLLAAISRSRMQLVALSNLSILAMSAVGGSMFPRFLMPESIQKIGLLTLNAWAIDGFQKVFWREEPLVNLWPQVSVLLAASVLLFAICRRLARRWDVA